MAAIVRLTTSLLIVYTAHSYILLTANMDDVQAIASQVASSPVVNQLGKIWRRAASQFHRRLNTPVTENRAIDFDSDDGDDSARFSDAAPRNGRRAWNDLKALTKNATGYFKALRRIYDEFMNQ